ncbi:MAG: quinolinate synthase NadA [Candidatus Gracilibacteria bacterium]|nr:quinolinate synthase NadA [Candidatus Gracilibacteria bacterium]MDD5178949.1 quinolinate synthase NadA [Candidatus Gracilibacteria bacterium]
MEKAEIISRIMELKQQKNAVILAHSYQPEEIYDVADFVGDSLELSLQAMETSAKIIVFCGVHFMAESAKILNPEKKVLLPEVSAGCFLANCATAEAVKAKKKEFPAAAAVCYINSSAAVKAECDAVITSANAVKVVKQLPQQQIILIPDENLGSWIAEQLPEKEIILWKGNCNIHAAVNPEEVEKAKRENPEAKVIAHPECPKVIRGLADEVCGTSGMLRSVSENEAKEFLIITEPGMLTQLKRKEPSKKFTSLCGECADMKKITLEKVLHSLETETPEITVEKKIAQQAKVALDKMMELS